MARFVIPVCVELEIEAEDVGAALRKAHGWRDGLLDSMSGGLHAGGVSRFRMTPLREALEVDLAWMENRDRRPADRCEWCYDTREVPVLPGSSVTVSHRLARGPKSGKNGQD